jgi:ribose transport system permease protein
VGKASASRLVVLVENYGVLLGLLVTFVAFSIALPSTFPTWPNVRAMLDSQAVVLILAIAETLPLRAGDFDLSISALMIASGCLTAELMTNGSGLLVAILSAVALGGVVGLINGYLVVKIGVDSFVTTLGMATALGGIAYAVVNSRIVTDFPSSLLTLARHQTFGLPNLTWFGWGLVIIAWYVYERTPVGRQLLFIGGSPDSARLAGVKVDRLRMFCLLGSAIISSLAGVVFAGSLGQIDPSLSSQFLLQPFAGAFLGATVITVGRVNAVGTMIALYLLVVGITGLQLLGAQPWVSDVFNGVALVLAVTFARIAAKSRVR